MISINKINNNHWFRLSALAVLLCMISACGVYSFKDISIPAEVKTVRVNFIENKARYINPQLSPALTEKLRQKINNQTRLTLIQGDDAHYDISCTITDYNVTTSGIANQQAASNRLNISVQINLKNRLDDKKSFDATISRNFDFPASQSLAQAEA